MLTSDSIAPMLDRYALANMQQEGAKPTTTTRGHEQISEKRSLMSDVQEENCIQNKKVSA
jgi:hypothetical protein